MLIAINPLDCIHSAYIYNYINTDLNRNELIYVLDTDDLVVESISYDDLYEYVKFDALNVQNVSYDDEHDCLYLNESYFTFMEAIERNFIAKSSGVIYNIDDKNKNNGIISIYNKSYKLKVGKAIKRLDGTYSNPIYLNGIEIGHVSTNNGLYFNSEYVCDPASSSKDGSGFYGISYIAKLNEYLLVHFSIIDSFKSYNMCLVLGKKGGVVDIFALNGFEDYFIFDNFSKPSVFRTKYKTVHKERW